MRIARESNARTASDLMLVAQMSEPFAERRKGVYIGRTLAYGLPFMLDLDDQMNRNIAILGMSGSGKSYFLKSFLIRSCMQRKSRILIIDWNNEYEETVRFAGGRVVSLGGDVRINMFELYDTGNPNSARELSDSICRSLGLDRKETYALYSA